MSWTHEQKIEYLLRLPWTLVPDQCGDDRLLRVKEIPAAVGTGVTDDQLATDLWESLETALDAYVEFGDPIPLPPGVQVLPWDSPAAADVPAAVQVDAQAWQFFAQMATTAQEPAAEAREPERVPVAA